MWLIMSMQPCTLGLSGCQACVCLQVMSVAVSYHLVRHGVLLAPTGWGPAGDNWTTARIVAAGLGIRHVAAEVLPSGKADQVRCTPGCCRLGTLRAEVAYLASGTTRSAVYAVLPSTDGSPCSALCPSKRCEFAG